MPWASSTVFKAASAVCFERPFFKRLSTVFPPCIEHHRTLTFRPKKGKKLLGNDCFLGRCKKRPFGQTTVELPRLFFQQPLEFEGAGLFAKFCYVSLSWVALASDSLGLMVSASFGVCQVSDADH